MVYGKYSRSEKQERFFEEKLTMEDTKAELMHEVNERARYTNEDSAKKIACMQGMDYDGFR